MGTIGIVVEERDLEAVSTKIKLLNKQIWQLEEGAAVRYCYLFENGVQVPVAVEKVSVHEIFPEIRYVFDKRNQVVAQRACRNGRLLTTRENQWLSTNRKTRKNRELYFYQLVERIDDHAYAKKMLAEWHTKNARVKKS